MHAQARMRVYACFSLVPSSLCCHPETTEDWQETKLTQFKPSDYILSCPCNKETPKTSKPLREGIIRQNTSITQIMQEEADQVITLLTT
jgi:hypothetical protein